MRDTFFLLKQGQTFYDRAITVIKELKRNGLKVRGHNMVWSVEQFTPNWVRRLSGDQLRNTVRDHIQALCNRTKGLLESWDVNNEELHGQWFQELLQDPDYDLDLFRMVHQADPSAKLFLDDYSVVAQGAATGVYLAQALRYKAAPGVHLYGLGVQSHFTKDQEPSPTLIKERLDTLAQAGLPLWASELDVQVVDENTRADHYEKALRALYGHPAIEGITFWGFWDQAHYAGEPASLVKGDNFELTAAGRRVLDLFENEWMTDETHVLAVSGDNFTVRGFHGDYELHVRYQGQDIGGLKQTFTLGKTAETLDVHVTV